MFLSPACMLQYRFALFCTFESRAHPCKTLFKVTNLSSATMSPEVQFRLRAYVYAYLPHAYIQRSTPEPEDGEGTVARKCLFN